MIRTLLVDDEPIARLGLRTLLASHPDIAIVAECRTGLEARSAIAELAPDLVFLDVKMPDLDGFGALDATGEGNRPAVVFVTAFEDHARRAFDVHAVDYLLKPFDRDRFELALTRALARIDANRRQPARRLAIRDGRGVTVVDLEELSYVEARGNYVRLHTLTGRRVLHREPLAALTARLHQHGFAQVSRSALVNLAHLTHAKPLPNGRYLISLRDGTALPTSRRFASAVKKAVAAL